jgi:hypothetical protein
MHLTNLRSLMFAPATKTPASTNLRRLNTEKNHENPKNQSSRPPAKTSGGKGISGDRVGFKHERPIGRGIVLAQVSNNHLFNVFGVINWPTLKTPPSHPSSRGGAQTNPRADRPTPHLKTPHARAPSRRARWRKKFSPQPNP